MTAATPSPWRFCVAPMMDWTDRHCRRFHRALSAHARLYTEMVTVGAILHGDAARHLAFDPAEQPVALQLGGHEPAALAQAASIGAAFGYAEINLNCGCPSDRVQGGQFGACLMRTPARVAEAVAAMRARVSIPVTVKCRIGVDEQDPEEALFSFAAAVIAAGAAALIVHARKAWLQGLSPKDNRDVPPLDYGLVRRLKAAHPQMPIILNGGLTDWDAIEAALAPDAEGPAFDGVMLGRAAYQTPELLLAVDPRLFERPAPAADGWEALARLRPVIAAHRASGGRLHAFTRHMLGLFPGQPGARAFRRHLATEAVKPDADLATLDAALAHLRRADVPELAA